MIRLGLCCKFQDQPIKFATTTATAAGRIPRVELLAKLSRLCQANADALLAALRFCAENGIGCFRVNSQVLPLKTHPLHGYRMEDLPGTDEIISQFDSCGQFARERGLRTCFHPDQFIVLNSPRPEVVEASIRELEYQSEVAEWIGADVINVHGGGAYGDKQKALTDFARNLNRLSTRARSRLTIENDDTTYTPADLVGLCQSEGIPLVYDVHHHRCNRDGLSIEEATALALETWNREPVFHVSSPIDGWGGLKPARHHDYIDMNDFPDCWRGRNLTVEVEAKAKELAVLRLRDALCGTQSGPPRRRGRESEHMNIEAMDQGDAKQDSVLIQRAPDGRGFRLTASQCLRQPRDQVFAFFSDAFQLQTLTPPWLNFSVLTPAPIHIEKGTLIDYRLRVRGVPMHWQSCIREWEPPLRFRGVGVRGLHDAVFDPSLGCGGGPKTDGGACRDFQGR